MKTLQFALNFSINVTAGSRNRWLLVFGVLWALELCSCSHESSREKMDKAWDKSKASSSVGEMDVFWLDYRSPPDRPVQLWEFYCKHCSLVSRKPYMDTAEYFCTPPY